ncbi:MAG TPA: OmpA family protein [Terriglobales bacterium]|nr:OmpA family protein [Terriglobales bacterium]
MSRHYTPAIFAASALAALLALPLAAQTTQPTQPQQSQQATSPQSSQQPAAQPASSTTPAAQATASGAPLTPPVRQGFWGRMNPFARKKYVEGQLSPIRDRTNELDGLTAANAKSISDVDARSKEGIAAANDQAKQAAQTADQAQQQVQQDSQQAAQLNDQVGSVNTKLGSIDQYQVAQTAELHFKPGPAKLNQSAQQQLDTFLSGLDNQKGYVVEVTAYSTRKGQAGVAASQDLADTVVRYMVLNHNLPLYRIYTMGMGNATPAQMNQSADATTTTRHTAGGTVEIKILKNSLSQ